MNYLIELIKASLFTFLIIVSTACTDVYSDPPLHEAAKNGDLAEVKALVASGIPVNSKNGEGATPLHWAAFQGHIDVVKFLLSKRANVNARTNKGSTPLRLAITHKRKEVIKLLSLRGGEE